MNLFQAVIFSIVEGVSEFLPISSTGHLVLTSYVLKISQTEFVKSFEIIIQLGAILSVVFLYREKLLSDWNTNKKILISFLPTAILGLLFYKIIKTYLLGNIWVTILAMFIGGFLLIFLEKIYKSETSHIDKFEKLSYKKSFFIGLIQSVSMIPGVSRSAATIIGGMFLGLNRTLAAEYSFLLAIPTMTAATALDLYQTNFNFTSQEITVLVVGFIGSFITALLAIKFLLQFVKNHTFIPFGIYRIILSIIFFLLFIY